MSEPGDAPVRRATPRPLSTELEQAVLAGDPAVFDPFSGVELVAGAAVPRFRAAELGLEAPRFCQLCGRRMVVQVDPVGWTARCSRHGVLTDAAFDR